MYVIHLKSDLTHFNRKILDSYDVALCRTPDLSFQTSLGELYLRYTM